MAQESKSGNGMGVASLVLGIVMLTLGAMPIVWIAGILGIIFGVIGRKRVKAGTASNGTMAMWGLVLSIAGTVIWGVAKFVVGYNSI